MAEYLIKSETLTGIANAIREKTGTTAAISVNNMATEIASISDSSSNVTIETSTAACSVVGQRYNSYNSYAMNKSDYCGFNYSDWYAYCLQFSTPAFTGESMSLDFNIKINRGSRNNTASTVVGLRWALCTSDANVALYKNTTAEVIEENQLAVGRIAFAGLTNEGTYCTITIPCARINPNKIYYLFFWGDDSNGCDQDYCVVHPASNHEVNLTFQSGLISVPPYKGTVSCLTGLYDAQLEYIDKNLEHHCVIFNEYDYDYDFEVAKNTTFVLSNVNSWLDGGMTSGVVDYQLASGFYVFRATADNFKVPFGISE